MSHIGLKLFFELLERMYRVRRVAGGEVGRIGSRQLFQEAGLFHRLRKRHDRGQAVLLTVVWCGRSARRTTKGFSQ